MARKKKDNGAAVGGDGGAPAAPETPGRFVRVRKGYVLLWPFGDARQVRAVAGDVLLADDPLLDTTGMDLKAAKRWGIFERVDNRWRVEPAPEATTHTVKLNAMAARFYDAVAFDGYLDERAAARAAAERKKMPPPPTTRKEPEKGAVTDDDLAVPPRDPVPH